MSNEIEPLEFELNTKLQIDDNGITIAVDVDNWQTLHRIDGRVVRNGEPVNIIKFGLVIHIG